VPPNQSLTQQNKLGLVQEGATAAALAVPTPAATSSAPGKLQAPTPSSTATSKPVVAKEQAKPSAKHKEEKVAPTGNTAKVTKPTKAEQHAKAKTEKAVKTDSLANAANAAKAEKAATKAAEKSLANNGATASSAPESGKFLINVGLFADDNNARNALVKLQDAGLPAVSQEIKSSKGKRTRVRVGPFETQSEADQAAERIRALQLEAVVFKQ
jgi:cell division protein FtsN